MEAEEHDTDWSPAHVINKKSDVSVTEEDPVMRFCLKVVFHNKIYIMYLVNI